MSQQPQSDEFVKEACFAGLFDIHAHLDDERFNEDRNNVIRKCRSYGMTGIINAGADMASSAKSIELAEKYSFIYAAVGIHPHAAREATAADYKQIENWLVQNHRVVALGEIGLDYHYDFSPRNVQKQVFADQLDIARRTGKPVVIHNRESHADMLEVLEHQKNVTGVFHCYSGSVEMLKKILNMGLYISVGGPVTFANATKLREVVRHVPDDRLLLETDCPYLTPVPFRGKRNLPFLAGYTAGKIAEIKGRSVQEIIRQTADNARVLFGI